ncbi:MAG: HIT family protein [Planctomycetota bacterium]
MPESIFTKIVAGEIPCHRLYEDEHVLAFLDIGPISRGHCLLIPKVCYVELNEMPGEVGAAVGRALPRLVAAVTAATGCDGINILQNNGSVAGQVVMHVHFHLIPRYAGDGAGLQYQWSPGELSPEDAAELQNRIVSSMSDN